MASKSARQVQEAMESAVDLFVKLVRHSQKTGTVSIDALEGAAQAFKKIPPFHKQIEDQHRLIHSFVTDEVLSSRRTNFFGRLMLETIAPLWKTGELHRSTLPNILSFFRLVLGEDEAHFHKQCADIVLDLRKRRGDEFDWDDFHQDPRSKIILYRVLVRIAQSFNRFDARRDWFIKLMQYEQSSMSLGSNAFVPLQDAGEIPPFTARHFNILMRGLFAPIRSMTEEDDALFVRELSITRAKAFGTLFSNMAHSATSMN